MWHIGQRVVCIYDFPQDGDINPIKGNIYTIREIKFFSSLNEYGFTLEEIHNMKKIYSDGVFEPQFSEIRFRPLDEKRIDIFRAMLKEKEKVE